jgi:hypothetical protein
VPATGARGPILRAVATVNVPSVTTNAAGEVDVYAVLGSVKAPLRGPSGLWP